MTRTPRRDEGALRAAAHRTDGLADITVLERPGVPADGRTRRRERRRAFRRKGATR